ncbi:MAG: hypothetical protein WCB11_12750, partial [Terriglobales bacterium]
MAEDIKAPAPPPPEGEKKMLADVRPAAAAKAAARAQDEVPVPVPWTSPLVEKYRNQYGSGLEALTYLGQNYFIVDRSL